MELNLSERLQQLQSSENTLRWRGTLSEYLELVEKHPTVASTAHARVYDMLMFSGINEENGVKKYKFFENEIFGAEEPIHRLVEEYFHSAARRLDVRKRILLLMGPVSSGKSTIVTLLKRGLEKYSRTLEGAVYAIAECPMHEEPLHLIPASLRKEVESAYGVHIEGDLCPVCQQRIEEEFKGDIMKVPVERIFLSETKRVGIGTFAPSDPRSQDIADLIGSVDLSTIAEYGSESDPRAFRFDGELNRANRGLLEMQEMLKIDQKFLYHLLSLTQEGNFKAGRFGLISADELVIAHTNQTEFDTFTSNKKNEALQSRMIVMPIPYNLRASDEVKIYNKLIGQSDISQLHIAPHGLETAAFFSVLTRLKESTKIDPVRKLKLYDGQDLEKSTEINLREVKQEHLDEGMSGIDPRYIINRISTALVKEGRSCINALDILRSIKDGLDQHPGITAQEREKYLNFVGVSRSEFDEKIKRDIQKAFVFSYEDTAKTLFDNYLENVDAFVHHQKIPDPITDEEREPDETLMRQIEDQIGISQAAKRQFREDIMVRMSSLARKGQKFTFDSHSTLKEAIEKKLFHDLRDVVKITANSRTPDPDQSKRVNDVVQTLVDNYGYCPVCANEMIRYVGSLLSR